jgi:hypothetical protein
VLAILRLPVGSPDDDLVEAARLAALDYCIGRIDPSVWGTDATGKPIDPLVAHVPAGVYEAMLLLASRFFRRRDSLDGTIGWGDMGVVRVGLKDPDADALLARYMAVVVG